MQLKRLGWTDLNLTRIGLGTWAMGGGGWAFGWGPQDDNESIKAIHRALDLGANWIDTAPAYGLGHGEEMVGRALQEMPTRPLIATKCGRSWDQSRRLYPSLKKEVVRAEVEASLKRLKIDVIDLMQKGILTGKLTRERIGQLAEDDHRRKDPQFQEPLVSANLELVEGLRQVAEKNGRTVAQLAHRVGFAATRSNGGDCWSAQGYPN